MNADEMKKCPYCAEMIRAEAVKCRYCGSMLAKAPSGGLESQLGYWHRVNEGKKIAGVCTGIARQLDAPAIILWLRVFFVITTLVYMFGPILYVLLWLLMPAPAEEGQPAAQQPAGGATTPPPPGGSPYSQATAPPSVNNYPGAKGEGPTVQPLEKQPQPQQAQPAGEEKESVEDKVDAGDVAPAAASKQDDGTIELDENEQDDRWKPKPQQ
jgi:phage shock protein PspC (stress-responsive transcriptional regulator)